MAGQPIPLPPPPRREVDVRRLREFLRMPPAAATSFFYVPQFHGRVTLETAGGVTLEYPGNTFSQRDARAAIYVALLLGNIGSVEDFEMKAASAFHPQFLPRQNTFLFGSRSNLATLFVVEHFCRARFFSFSFDGDWEIRCADGTTFGIPNPSRMSEFEYSSKTDYGVVARINVPGSDYSAFILAGLGSRATEGCAYYFCSHWQELMKSFGTGEFVGVLELSPPVNPREIRVAKTLSGF